MSDFSLDIRPAWQVPAEMRTIWKAIEDVHHELGHLDGFDPKVHEAFEARLRDRVGDLVASVNFKKIGDRRLQVTVTPKAEVMRVKVIAAVMV